MKGIPSLGAASVTDPTDWSALGYRLAMIIVIFFLIRRSVNGDTYLEEPGLGTSPAAERHQQSHQNGLHVHTGRSSDLVLA